MDNIQAILTVSVPTLAVLVGILINNSRLSDLSKRLDGMERRSDQRFADLKETWRAEWHRVEEVLDARLKHLEELRQAGPC
jgi:hypothetical protein